MNPRPAYLDRLSTILVGSSTRHPSRPGDQKAAVVLPIIDDGEPCFVGIVRDDSGPHGGQFALPGGMPEAIDQDSWQTAVRELAEEVGEPQAVDFLGQLGEYNTYSTRFRVFVHVAHIRRPVEWCPQEEEVQGVFQVPFSLLVPLYKRMPVVDDVLQLPIEVGFEFDAQPYLVSGILPARGRGHINNSATGSQQMPFIWGLTARILYDFLRMVWIPSQTA